MKSTLLASSTALFLAVAACANNAPTVTTGEGGAPGSGGSTGGSSSTGTGGASSGGSTGTGGGVSSGGSTGTGGSVSSGGTTGTGGSVSTGGSTGSGGATASGGTTGTGATAGSLGNNGDFSSIVGTWDGALEVFPCTSLSNDGFDCPNAPTSGSCGSGKTTSFTFPISGTAGTIYNVTLEAKGIVEVYAYLNTDRGNDATSIKGSGELNNLFSVGGTQQTSGNGNDYNTYELDVSPAVAGLTNVVGTGSAAYNNYYLNSVTQAQNPHIGAPTQHLTFSIDDTATIKVPGGGTVTFKSYDSNCVEVQNCGVTSGSTCTSPQTVSLAGAEPPAPMFSQPYVGPKGGHGQFVFFDITNVTVAQ